MGRKSRRKTSALLGAFLVPIAAWFVLGEAHVFYLVNYAEIAIGWIRVNLSIFRVTLIIGFGGSLLSIPLLRRRGRNREASKESLGSVAAGREVKSRPLMLTPRPSRDSQFVIRKTKKRGRLSRNREGERLPTSLQE